MWKREKGHRNFKFLVLLVRSLPEFEVSPEYLQDEQNRKGGEKGTGRWGFGSSFAGIWRRGFAKLDQWGLNLVGFSIGNVMVGVNGYFRWLLVGVLEVFSGVVGWKQKGSLGWAMFGRRREEERRTWICLVGCSWRNEAEFSSDLVAGWSFTEKYELF